MARRTNQSPEAAPTRRVDGRPRASILSDASALRWRHGERLEDVLEEACRRFSERIAISVGGLTVTFAELNARADQMARYFASQGLKAGDRVGVLLDRGVEAYVALFALLKARATYVPLDPNHPPERIRYILADAGATLVVAHLRLADRLSGLEIAQITLDNARSAVAAFPMTPLGDAERGRPADSLCYVLYTSGTTGHPKGVAVAHPSICNFVRVAAELYGFAPGERVYQGMSIAFDFSIEELWVPLVAGATLVPNLAAASLFGEELAEFLDANDVSGLCCVPTLLASIERDLPKLQNPADRRGSLSAGHRQALEPRRARPAQQLRPDRGDGHRDAGPHDAGSAGDDRQAAADLFRSSSSTLGATKRWRGDRPAKSASPGSASPRATSIGAS